MLVIFAGCSGVGKDTVMKRVISQYPQEFIKYPSYTTRAMRQGESEGNPYCFVSEADFLRMLDAGEFFEYNYIHGRAYYGASKKTLSDYMALGKTLFKDVDVEGVRTYKHKLASTVKTISIYLYCSDEETVIARLRARGDAEEDIAKRRKRFAMENELSCESDYMVNNIDLDTTAAIVKTITDTENGMGLYLPKVLPSEAEIAAANGDTAPVLLCYNGTELIITEGAARYISALRNGTFIQKKVESSEVNTELKPACGESEFARLING